MTPLTVVSLQNPQDLSYLFSGYAPLSIKLLEVLEKQQGFAAFEEVCTIMYSSVDVTLGFLETF